MAFRLYNTLNFRMEKKSAALEAQVLHVHGMLW